ncbi:sigma-70 family RNA polymerase sigma factor [Leptospira biflexa]|jgi:RNA polymerase sigma factor (sigma-70 family)|uniref:sigma-70 family RNA polymerase sigma factor n=1 Tax=Leptospira biflexa TaxID=172 RepID=UPI001082E24E|nr:sigma-70 family RNA polymerase sigma factor [Leptospira biflexa]TGM31854.1 sigma-70 family RNA polymerase sigma factor [Leptospira biflexa]TGM36996.1 sigma-70 family RNA polymerase sigma factor [Leptospira biflexa]TGM46541.1 sigma-70 family RNA polymerase sigma factor [Leptospira biflexa]TGM50997.1 sigma-70 family RNA polymerase sigma factor [Leptospira biflexa]TGM56270.1 sigma-70 family RNA polymerase sigma factor [Leptospira biflexa]
MNQTSYSTEEILELVKECGTGNEKALEKFFEHYSQDIYNFPIRVFHLTEDDASDYYIYAFERLKSGKRFKSFVGKSSFKTWFFSVLRNLLIDWQRTKREVKTQTISKVNQEGKEYSTIEDEPDTRADALALAHDVTDQFQSVLSTIKMENRIVFKLSFVYYLHLDPEELQFVAEKTKRSEEEIRTEILNLREDLSHREEDNLKMEDKITSLYLNILDLKEQKKQKAQGDSVEAQYYKERLDHALAKKYEQRKKLIEKKQKGHFLVRTPYREIARILGISEGGVSVTLLRVLEKIQKKMHSIAVEP